MPLSTVNSSLWGSFCGHKRAGGKDPDIKPEAGMQWGNKAELSTSALRCWQLAGAYNQPFISLLMLKNCYGKGVEKGDGHATQTYLQTM